MAMTKWVQHNIPVKVRVSLRREVDACRRAPGASGKRFQMIELE